MYPNLTVVSTEDLLKELLSRAFMFARDMANDDLRHPNSTERPTRNDMIDRAVDYVCHTMPEVLEVDETDLAKERKTAFEKLLVDIASEMVNKDRNLITLQYIPS